VIELGRFTVDRTAPVLRIQVVEREGSQRRRLLGEIGGGAGSEGGEISRVEGSAGQDEGTAEGEVPRWRRAPRQAQAPPEGEERHAGVEPVEERPDETGLPRRD
jgi:hypothetical protein